MYLLDVFQRSGGGHLGIAGLDARSFILLQLLLALLASEGVNGIIRFRHFDF